jgi:hypothetical protein
VSYPTETQQYEQTDTTSNGTEFTSTVTVWPAAPIVLVAPDPEPPGGK